MSYQNNLARWAVRSVIAMLLLIAAHWTALADPYFNTADPVASVVSRSSHVRNWIESDSPGSADPASPYVWPSRFGAELSVRPVFITMTKGTFVAPALGIGADLTKSLGFVEQGVLVELKARASLGRYAARAQYDAWLRTFRGIQGNLDWPPLRLGADIGLFETHGLRVGADMDFYPEGPKFSLATPAAKLLIQWPRPVTVGLHATYNAPCYLGVSTSMEMRFRLPIRSGTKITEFEVAGGMRFPETVLGTSVFRAGWRYSQIEHDTPDARIAIDWSGFFGEYVFYY